MQHVKSLKLSIYSVNLPWLNLSPVFVHRQDQIVTRNSICLPKDFTQTNKILHRHACGACDKFHVSLYLKAFDALSKVRGGIASCNDVHFLMYIFFQGSDATVKDSFAPLGLPLLSVVLINFSQFLPFIIYRLLNKEHLRR